MQYLSYMIFVLITNILQVWQNSSFSRLVGSNNTLLYTFLGRFPLSRFPPNTLWFGRKYIAEKNLHTYHSFSFSSELFHPQDNTQYRIKSRITFLILETTLTYKSVYPKICIQTLFVLNAINISWNIESSIQNNKIYVLSSHLHWNRHFKITTSFTVCRLVTIATKL